MYQRKFIKKTSLTFYICQLSQPDLTGKIARLSHARSTHILKFNKQSFYKDSNVEDMLNLKSL